MASGAEAGFTLVSWICAFVGFVIASVAEPRRARRMPGTLPYRWGLFQGYSAMTFGALMLCFGFLAMLEDSDGGGAVALIGIGALYAAPGYYVTQRFRWAWVLISVLSLNPVSWIINWIYGRNRWNEFGSVPSRVEGVRPPSI